MRYLISENTFLVGHFLPKRNVVIKIIDLSQDKIINTTNNICVESQHLPGVYIWSTANLDKTGLVEYSTLLYEMTSLEDGRKTYGKFIFGGYVEKLNGIDVIISNTEDIKDDTNIIKALV